MLLTYISGEQVFSSVFQVEKSRLLCVYRCPVALVDDEYREGGQNLICVYVVSFKGIFEVIVEIEYKRVYLII